MNALKKTGNFFIKFLLRSPFHGVISRNTLLISYTGRKSGKSYTTPTNYSQDGMIVRIVSFRYRTWWRNLLGGAPVSLLIRGENIRGWAEVIMDNDSVTRGLKAYLQPIPKVAKYFDIILNENGTLNAEDIIQAAKKRVIVEVTLEG